MATDDERKAIKKAQEILCSLTLSTPRTDQIIFALGYAAGIAAEGSTSVSSTDHGGGKRRSGIVCELPLQEHIPYPPSRFLDRG